MKTTLKVQDIFQILKDYKMNLRKLIAINTISRIKIILVVRVVNYQKDFSIWKKLLKDWVRINKI